MAVTWERRNTLVTGATGLLGSCLVEELLRCKTNVTCLIRDRVPRSRLYFSGAVARVVVVDGDVQDAALLHRVIREYEIDTVFHLAAQTLVDTALYDPLQTFRTNIEGTWNLLEACRSAADLVQRVVIASSDKAYGPLDEQAYVETAPLRGQAPYDVSKACCDLLAQSYFATFHVPLAVTRCANLFGGGDLNFSRLIPGTIYAALTGQRPVIRSDGSLVRDYLYVEDAAKAYLALADALPKEGVVGEAFNFGYETPQSVLDVTHQILEFAGRQDLAPDVLSEARHEIAVQRLECTKARHVLGWRPEHEFAAGLRETIDWYREWLSAGTPVNLPAIYK